MTTLVGGGPPTGDDGGPVIEAAGVLISTVLHRVPHPAAHGTASQVLSASGPQVGVEAVRRSMVVAVALQGNGGGRHDTEVVPMAKCDMMVAGRGEEDHG